MDIQLLEKARIQLLSATQLVCSVPRSYLDGATNEVAFPRWNGLKSRFFCRVASPTEMVEISLDVKDLVLSLSGEGRHTEHLVLSGITYPMAYGWMQVKLDSFGFSGELFSDATSATYEQCLGADEDMTVFDQQVFDDIAVYFSNAANLLRKVNEMCDLSGQVCINPADISMILLSDLRHPFLQPGFAIGSRNNPEPHFFIHATTDKKDVLEEMAEKSGYVKNKDWAGLILPVQSFTSHEQDEEYRSVLKFFMENIQL